MFHSHEHCNSARQWQERFGELPADTTLSFQTFWPRDLGMPATHAAKAIELKLIAADAALPKLAEGCHQVAYRLHRQLEDVAHRGAH